ncbi:MAG: PAS domain-containing sensor histidine kinase [Flavipsychrobacter sp.]|nr:PAS domain-containing sensor histidine kinase [Flavipsychrobacter sp.]
MNTQSANKEFQALFNNAAIGIIIINAEGSIVLANGFSLKQFGYHEQELIGKKIEVLIPSRYREKHVKHRDHYHGRKAHSRPMGVGMDLFAIKKDGTEFPVEVSLSPHKSDTGQFSIAFISDISIRKQSEQALLQLNAELEQKVEERTHSLSVALEKEKELNELKSRFVSMASHEFRTPLSTILSSAYLVNKYVTTEDQPKRDKHIQRIISSVHMLTDILNDFLSVGRIEEGKIQVRFIDFDIEQHINALLNELQTLLKTSQELKYVHTGSRVINLDPSLLSHILMNLISNAIKFSPEASSIDIKTESGSEGIYLSVKDHGLGMSKADQEHLFERFFRSEAVTTIQGTGLGLHIVSKYTELMNGSIECVSEEFKGTEFIINFKPLNKEKS